METPRELFQIMTRRLGLLNKDCCSVRGCKLSAAQSHLLYEIARSHNPSMQQVAEVLGTDITTFSRQVQSLVKMNLVKRHLNPAIGESIPFPLLPKENWWLQLLINK